VFHRSTVPLFHCSTFPPCFQLFHNLKDLLPQSGVHTFLQPGA
jgi:hypothetical protein